jgi:ketosteroid isomerase-like protein
MPGDGPLVELWADAINARDLPTLLEMAHPEIELYPLQFGVSGHYGRHEGVTRWMSEVRAWDPGHRVRYEKTWELGGGRVALFGTIFIDDEPFSPYALVVEIRDGRIARMRSYLNDEETLEKLGVLTGG